MRALLLVFCCFLLYLHLNAQACNNPGQTPGTAFPVCGTAVFTQQTVPLCSGRKLPSPGCSSDELTDVNPFYYKFTCFEAGTLGFTIDPKTLSDDYDWELYDITGRNPEDIFTDGSLVVASNWSGEGGKTGAGKEGRQLFVCAGFGQPLWSTMPVLKKEHSYLLLISHFTQSQSGYGLSFGGGTAVITDPLPPALKEVSVHCDSKLITLRLNKKLRCNSLAADGSEFVILPGNVPATGASSLYCSGGFDTDSIEIKLARQLAPGDYQLAIRKGSDNNTLLDFCDNSIAAGQAVSFAVLPAVPMRPDSIAPVGCAPRQVQLVFKKPVYCNTIAPDGSDFVIQGPYAVNIRSATGDCNGGLSKVINLQLAAPMVNAGSFKVMLRRQATGGTVVDECGIPVAEGAVSFQVADTVSAGFSYQVTYGCDKDVVQFSHSGGRGVNRWRWLLDDGFVSTEQHPQVAYTLFQTKNIRLAVSNGVCSNTAQVQVKLENFLSAGFSMAGEECPNEPVQFTSIAEGQDLQHHWEFGDGGTSEEVHPVYRFAAPLHTRSMQVRYSVTDRFGCTKAVVKPITIYSSCTIYVPNAFTPDGDGRNDIFRPLNVLKVAAYEFVVYNRWGQEVFRTRDPKQGWDGAVGGIMQNTGTYVWMMRYTEKDSNKPVVRKGSFVLIR